MLKGLFSRNQYKYRKFDYQPMYYDERKEKLNMKIKQSELKDGDNSEDAMKVRKEMMRSQMSTNWQSSKSSKSFMGSNYRSIFIIVLLGIVAYYILFKLDIKGFLEKYI